MNASEQINEIAAALAKARAKFPKIKKNKEVDVSLKSGGSYSYKYADLENILEAITPALSENGLCLTQDVSEDEKKIVTKLMHASGQWISSTFPLLPKGPSMQEVGGAHTYSRRYGINGLLSISSEDDTDGGPMVADVGTAGEVELHPRKHIGGESFPVPNHAPGARSKFVMPFGKAKDKLFSELSHSELVSAQSWAKSKGKFLEFQKDVDEYLKENPAPKQNGEIDESEESPF